MPHVLVLDREPEAVSPSERQAVACALRVRVETLEFERVDAPNADVNRHTVRVHVFKGGACVLLNRPEQASMVAPAVAAGVPHFLFARDHSASGSNLGNRLFWLSLSGELTLCRRANRP